MMPKFIVIEGIDNVGKTTSAELLAVELANNGFPAEYYKTPHKQFGYTTSIVNSLGSRDTHFLYHAAMVKYAEQQIIKLLKQKSVVCDRWFYSTYAYHIAAGSSLNLHWDLLMEYRPDHAFLLTCEEGERMRRARSKGNLVEDHDLKTKDEEPILKEAENILKNAGLFLLDTTNDPLDKVVRIMFEMVVS